MNQPVSLSAVRLDPHRHPLRRSPRPASLRHADYSDQFDATTLFFDAFWDHSGRRILLLGPPLLNLATELPLQIRAIPSNETCTPHFIGSTWLCRAFIEPPSGTTELVLRIGDTEARLTPQPWLGKLFDRRRVITTLQKDNEPIWIRDWVTYYRRCHGCDGVLIYDNNSTRYSADEVRDFLSPAARDVAVMIVPWPFPYGVADWRLPRSYHLVDSLFCQTGMLEHARHRFLTSASSVANVDIDELIVTDPARSVFELTERSPTGLLQVDGVWVEPDVPGARTVRLTAPRFRDFREIGTGPQIGCEKKWVVVPRRVPELAQWHIHGIIGMTNSDYRGRVELRHFKAINSDWNIDRPRSDERRSAAQGAGRSERVVDPLLDEALRRAFDEDDDLLPATAIAPPRRAPRSAVIPSPASPANTNDAWSHFQHGSWLEDDGQPDAARQAYEAAIRSDPCFNHAYRRLFLIETDPRRRLACLDEWEAHPPTDDTRAVHHAQVAEALEKEWWLDRAVHAARSAVAIEPANLQFRCLLARLLVKRGDLAGAEVELRRAMNAQWLPEAMGALDAHGTRTAFWSEEWFWYLPWPTGPYIGLAEVLAARGKVVEAAELARSAVQLGPADTHTVLRAGLCLRASGQDESSIWEHARRLAERDCARATFSATAAHHRDAYWAERADTLARVLEAGGWVDEAVTVLRRALLNTPRSVRLHERLARILLTQERTAAAVSALRDALVMLPDHPLLEFRLSQALATDDPAAALALARRAALGAPREPYVREHLAGMLLREGALDEAEAVLTDAMAHGFRSGAVHYFLSRLASQRGQPDLAERVARAALAVEPRLAYLHERLLELLIESRRFPDAMAQLEAARGIGLGSSSLWYFSSRIHRYYGRLPSAIEDAERAVALQSGATYLHQHLESLLRQRQAWRGRAAALLAAAIAPVLDVLRQRLRPATR